MLFTARPIESNVLAIVSSPEPKGRAVENAERSRVAAGEIIEAEDRLMSE